MTLLCSVDGGNVTRARFAALVVMVVSLVGALAFPPAASAAPATPPRAVFSGVSCPSPSFCMAVGDHLASDGTPAAAFADTFDGTSWHRGPAPLSGTSAFGAVSCVDRNFCVATATVHGAARAVRWNGTTWTAVTLGGTSPEGLVDVQCRSRTFCMLIGGLTNRYVPAAWHYNGYAWYPQTLPHPGAHSLSSVSCPTTTICFAAGNHHVGYKSYAYVVRWGGKGWHASHLPHHSGTFTDITCLTTTRCTAVGDPDTISGAASGLVVDLANGKWTYSFLSQKRIDDGSPVSGVRLACTRVACTAVLSYEPGGDVNSADLIAVRGTSGAFVLGKQRFPSLTGLSCAGSSCIVVGSTLADIRNSDTLPPKPTSATAYRRHGTTLARFGGVPQG